MLEGIFQYIQEKFQQTLALPLDENEIDQHLDVEIHVPFLEFDEGIHILSDQDKDVDSYTNLSLDHLFSEMFFQNEKSYQIQNSEIVCMETQNNEITLK